MASLKEPPGESFISISSLNPPALPDESTCVKAVVALIFPYSSATKSAALLIAESDFRLRRNKGQVRVLLNGPAAKAVATSGVGIGDTVVLSLAGAKWVQDGPPISTPGRSVDGELLFHGRLQLEIIRNQQTLATLAVNEPDSQPDNVDATRTSEPEKASNEIQTPVPKARPDILRGSSEWESPAFFWTPLSERQSTAYDPFVLNDEETSGKGRKRPRFSAGWRYARSSSEESRRSRSSSDSNKDQSKENGLLQDEMSAEASATLSELILKQEVVLLDEYTERQQAKEAVSTKKEVVTKGEEAVAQEEQSHPNLAHSNLEDVFDVLPSTRDEVEADTRTLMSDEKDEIREPADLTGLLDGTTEGRVNETAVGTARSDQLGSAAPNVLTQYDRTVLTIDRRGILPTPLDLTTPEVFPVYASSPRANERESAQSAPMPELDVSSQNFQKETSPSVPIASPYNPPIFPDASLETVQTSSNADAARRTSDHGVSQSTGIDASSPDEKQPIKQMPVVIDLVSPTDELPPSPPQSQPPSQRQEMPRLPSLPTPDTMSSHLSEMVASVTQQRDTHSGESGEQEMLKEEKSAVGVSEVVVSSREQVPTEMLLDAIETSLRERPQMSAETLQSQAQDSAITSKDNLIQPVLAQTTVAGVKVSQDIAAEKLPTPLSPMSLRHLRTRLEQNMNGFRTKSSYYTPLSSVESLLNPPSQGPNEIDVMGVLTDSISDPMRARKGPKDFVVHMKVADFSTDERAIKVDILRPYKLSLPVGTDGDVILLRNFVVKGRKLANEGERETYLLSNHASGWVVWRSRKRPRNMTTGDDARSELPKNETSDGEALKEECNGPPVELGNEERAQAMDLRKWWEHADELRKSETSPLDLQRHHIIEV